MCPFSCLSEDLFSLKIIKNTHTSINLETICYQQRLNFFSWSLMLQKLPKSNVVQSKQLYILLSFQKYGLNK